MAADVVGRVVGLKRGDAHDFTKEPVGRIRLLAGLGVEGDAHCGATVQHRSRVAADPTQPNLRQVHLVHGELLDELQERGFDVEAGGMGENVTTRGVDLLGLATGTVLRLGPTALVALTGLRNPCGQLDTYRRGLLGAVRERRPDGDIVRRAGVMGVVVLGGVLQVGDEVVVQPPPRPWRPLEVV